MEVAVAVESMTSAPIEAVVVRVISTVDLVPPSVERAIPVFFTETAKSSSAVIVRAPVPPEIFKSAPSSTFADTVLPPLVASRTSKLAVNSSESLIAPPVRINPSRLASSTRD